MRWWRLLLPWAFWLPFGFASYMAWTPLEHPEIPQSNDKFMHVLAFGYLTGVFSIAYAHWTTCQRTAGIMLAYAVLIEVVQAFIPNRSCSLLDVVADGMAIALALSGLYLLGKVSDWWRRGRKAPSSQVTESVAALPVREDSHRRAQCRPQPCRRLDDFPKH